MLEFAASEFVKFYQWLEWQGDSVALRERISSFAIVIPLDAVSQQEPDRRTGGLLGPGT